MKKEQKVILIGGDHYNGLALVRMFGEHGLHPYGIIVGRNSGQGFLRKSKYWNRIWCIESDEEILPILKENFNDEEDKPVIIPYSDGATSILDIHLQEFKGRFILSSINSEPGKIYELMDKGKQVEFAKACGLNIAKSFEIFLDSEYPINEIPFPCIGKPIVSCEGDKKDIKKIENRTEMVAYLDALKNKGYTRILIQEYVKIDKEYDVEGFVNNNENIYFCNEKVRTWPNVGGPTAYAFSVDEQSLNHEIDKIVLKLKELGYSGLFDIEIFKVKGKFFFNEINWRNSAVCFAAKQSGVNYPLYWYYSITGQEYELVNAREYGIYAMNELLDFQHVKNRDVSPIKWISQLKRSKARAYYDKRDPEPLRQRFKMFLKRRGL